MKMRPELAAGVKCYTGGSAEAFAGLLDCSLGVNPYGCPDFLREVLNCIEADALRIYPHSRSADAAILKYWEDCAAVENKKLLLTDGSIAALYLACDIFALPEAEVLGFAPAFTDMVEAVRMRGMIYDAVNLREEEHLKLDADRLMKKISKRTSLIYIDNPHNPTGQLLPLSDIEKVLIRAGEFDACVLVDEAYGDFVEKKESSITLLGKYDNLIVSRTFSKGFGLAGIRAGYVFASEELMGCLKKMSNPYMMSEISRQIAAKAMSVENYAYSYADRITAMKKQIQEAVGQNLSMSATDMRVPIFTLIHKDKTVDLERRLLENGVLAVAGGSFDNLGANCVRMRVPRQEDSARMLEAIRAVDTDQIMNNA